MEYITHVETNKRTLFWTFIRYIRYAMSFLCLNMQKKTGKQQKKYTVAVCAIFKNESVFLKEWLEYHLLIGVEHFYLYNNFSEDNYQDILAPYIEKGQVTLTEWPVQFGQLPAYKDCFQKAKDETRWIAYIDLDEFICLRREQNIRNWIQKYDKYPTVYVNWKQFGTWAIPTTRISHFWRLLLQIQQVFTGRVRAALAWRCGMSHLPMHLICFVAGSFHLPITLCGRRNR